MKRHPILALDGGPGLLLGALALALALPLAGGLGLATPHGSGSGYGGGQPGKNGIAYCGVGGAPPAPAAPTSPRSAPRPMALDPGATSPGSPGPTAPTTHAPALDTVDLSSWSVWWGFNRDVHLQLKRAVWRPGAESGSDAFHLGDGEARAAAASLRPTAEELREVVAPALVRALETETSASIVTSSMISLGQIGEVLEGERRRVADLVRSRIDDPNQTISETAVVSLALLRDHSVLPELTALLEDTRSGAELCDRTSVPERTRAFAAFGLGLVGERSSNVDVRRYVLHHLIDALGEETSDSAEVGVACATALGMVLARDVTEDAELPPAASRAAQARFLATAIESDQRRDVVRAHLARSLARVVAPLGDHPLKELAAETLIDQLNARAPRELEYGAVLALGLLGDADGDDVDASIRRALVQVSGSGDSIARHFALLARAQVAARPGSGAGGEAADLKLALELRRQVAGGASRTRPWAALALGLRGHGRAEAGLPLDDAVSADLRAALADTRSPEEAAAQAIALGLRRDLRAEELLLEKLAFFEDGWTRGQLAVGLGLTGGHAAVPALRALVDDSMYQPLELRQAAIGLALLGDKTLVERLVGLMQDTESSAVKGAVASVLGFVGDASAIEPLVAMLADRRLVDRARAYAAVALGHVGDRDEIPWTAIVATNVNYHARVDVLLSGSSTGLLDMR
jgi:HEAT repeat protein